MTMIEIIFALIMLAVSGGASSFALTSVILQERTFEQMQAVHDAEENIVACWLTHKPLPVFFTENGVTCKITLMDGGISHSEIQTFQIETNGVSQMVWLPVC